MKLCSIHLEGRLGLDVLYHGTTMTRLPAIMQRGLDPAESAYADEEKEDGEAEGFGPPYHFVYLSTEPDTAGDFAAPPTSRKSQPVILKVTLPQRLQKQLITNRGEFIRAPFVIPPQYIEVMT